MKIIVNKDGKFLELSAKNERADRVIECFFDGLIEVEELFESHYVKLFEVTILAEEVWLAETYQNENIKIILWA